jgi:hypothetical protein
MNTELRRKTFEEEWCAELKKPAGMSDAEWRSFLLYMRSSLPSYLLYPRWAWITMALFFLGTVAMCVAHTGPRWPDTLLLVIRETLPILFFAGAFLTLRLLDWFGKERLVRTVLGRKHPNGLL